MFGCLLINCHLKEDCGFHNQCMKENYETTDWNGVVCKKFFVS